MFSEKTKTNKVFSHGTVFVRSRKADQTVSGSKTDFLHETPLLKLFAGIKLYNVARALFFLQKQDFTIYEYNKTLQ